MKKSTSPINLFMDGEVILNGENMNGKYLSNEGQTFLVVDLPKNSENEIFFPFTSDNEKNVFPISVKKNAERLELAGLAGAKNVVCKKIMLRDNGYCLVPDKHPANMIRVAHLHNGGRCEIWDFFVVSQRGKFFLRRQKKYGFFVYTEGSGIRILDLDWPSLEEKLKKIISSEWELPLIGDYYEKESEIDHYPSFPKGVVVWYDQAKGLGKIKTSVKNKRGGISDIVARVHWSSIITDAPFAFLEAGDNINIQKIVPTDPTRGNFRWEVKGVRVE